MRIAIDATGAVRGGIKRILDGIVRDWPVSDDEVIVVGQPQPHDTAFTSPMGPAQRPTDRLQRTVMGLRRITSREADIVLVLAPSLVPLRATIPVVSIIHDFSHLAFPARDAPSSRAYRRMSYASTLRRSERLLCVSERTRHDLGGFYPTLQCKAAVWNPAWELRLDGSMGASPALISAQAGLVQDRWLTVVSNTAHKGADLAVAALARLPQTIGLAVIAPPELKAYLMRLAVEGGVLDRFAVLTGLNDAEYAQVIAASDGLLCPSDYEGFGLPAAEALGLGTAVAVSPDPALWEASQGRAVRMTAWTSDAMEVAMREVLASDRPIGFPVRSWAQATNELRERLVEVVGS